MSFLSSVKTIVHGRRDPNMSSKEDIQFQRMIEQSGDVICRVAENVFCYVSPSAKTVFGWEPARLLGTDGLGPIFEPDRPIVLDLISRLVKGEADHLTVQVRIICEDGSLKWVEATSSRPEARDGTSESVIVMRDISERKRLEDELAVLAHQDGLTGLANRRSFDLGLEQEWERTLQGGSDMALVLLDIDHFKEFNDLYGHQAGDDCLRAVAMCVSAQCRGPSDIACRYGGEELAIILGNTNLDIATSIADAVRREILALGIPHSGNSASNYVTASFGVAGAVAREGGSHRMPEGLLQSADHALYKAKSAGRNRLERTVLMAPSGQPLHKARGAGLDRVSARQTH